MKSNRRTPLQPSDQLVPKRPTLLQRLRTSLLAGLLVVAPFTITLWLAWSIIKTIDELVLPFIPEEYLPENPLPIYIPGAGLLIFLVFLVIVGWLAKNLFGREIIRIGESWVSRMPVVRSIYNALKQILETIFVQSSNSFERACIVEYPRRGIWAVGFVSTSTKGEILLKASGGGDMLSVFLPTTPNPTSGFLLFLPREDVILLDMTIEEAAKLVISAGLITPPQAGALEGPEDPARVDGPAADADADESPPEPRRPETVSPGRAAERAARYPLSTPRKR